MLLALTGLISACGQEAVAPVPTAGTPERLSEWHLVMREGSRLVLNGQSLQYDLNTPLFTDYAQKLRTVWLPEGTTASVTDDGVIEFPVGTVITKTFYYPQRDGVLVAAAPRRGVVPDLDAVRLIETRLLVRRAGGWEALPYVWDEKGEDARLSMAGDIQRVTLDHDGEVTGFSYVVPTQAECSSCHAWDHSSGEMRPIGPKLRHVSNIDEWVAAGILPPVERGDVRQTTDWPPDPTTSVEAVARSYLDINCGHCHSPIGPADTSGLFLHFDETSLRRLGACKQPVAAGRGSGGRLVSIAPGSPEDSIMHFRMQSTDPGEMMPEIGRSLVHEEGVAVIDAWIRSMRGECVAAI